MNSGLEERPQECVVEFVPKSVRGKSPGMQELVTGGEKSITVKVPF